METKISMSLQADAAISTDDGWRVTLNFNHAKSAHFA